MGAFNDAAAIGAAGLILNNINYSLVLFDDGLMLKYLNLPAQELTGYSDRALKGMTMEKFFGANPYIIEKTRDVADSGEGFLDFECKFENGIGQARFVILEISRILLESGFYILVSLKDVTRLRELEKNIESGERIEDLSRFIAEMSHEIRNPLGGIKASASYLKRKLDNQEFANFLEIIINESGRINNLIEDLLALSKKHKVKISPVNINKVINEILIMEQAGFAEKNMEAVKEFDPSLPAVHGSENALRQVFLNLIRNAEQSGKKGKGIILKISTNVDYTRNNPKLIRIDFSDNGCGIGNADMKNIFMPFFTTKENGSGLGLAVSRKIIMEHGGFMDIQSAKNKGTTVSVYIPIEKNGCRLQD